MSYKNDNFMKTDFLSKFGYKKNNNVNRKWYDGSKTNWKI